jgi:hypothetical protein
VQQCGMTFRPYRLPVGIESCPGLVHDHAGEPLTRVLRHVTLAQNGWCCYTTVARACRYELA